MEDRRERIGVWLLVTVALAGLFFWISNLTAGGDAPFDLAVVNYPAWIAALLTGLAALSVLIAASFRAVESLWMRLRRQSRS